MSLNRFLTVAFVLLAAAGGVIGYLAYDARTEVGDVEDRVIRLERPSVCQADPKSVECQAIFYETIRNFGRPTVCLLAERLGIPCPPPRDLKEADDARSDEPPAPGQAGSPRPAPGDPGAADGGSGGDGGDGVATPPPAPTDPGEPPNPPPPVAPPPPPGPEPKPPTVGGLGVPTPLDPTLCAVKILCA